MYTLLIKNMNFSNSTNLVLSLRKTQIEKKEFIIVKKCHKLFQVLLILEKYGYIRYFCVFSKKIKIYVRHEKIIRVFNKFKGLKINKNSLTFLIRTYPSSLFLLRTKNGIICHQEAFKQNSFGFIMAQIV